MDKRKAFFYEENNIKIMDCTSRYKFSVPLLKDKTVLDIGCGARMGPWIISANAAKVFALDISSEAVLYCSRAWKKNNIAYLAADAQKLPFASGIFDAVLSFEVIEHLDDYQAFLSEIQRILKRDGMLIITTTNSMVSSPDGVVLNPYHTREFNLEEFKNMLFSYFSDVSLHGQKPSLRVIQAEILLNIVNQNSFMMPEVLKRIPPRRLKKKIRDIYTYIFAKAKALPTPNQINEEDFIFDRDDIEKARNLLAICRK